MIGIKMTDLTNTYYLYRQGIVIPDNVDKSVVVMNLKNNYPAQQEGLQKGYIILTINDIQIENSIHFRFLLYK